MALISKQRIIDGRNVVVTTLPATAANQLLTKVLKYFGSGLVQLFDQIKSAIPELTKIKTENKESDKLSLLDLPIDLKQVAEVVNDFASKLTPEEWSEFCLKLFAYTDIDKVRIMDETSFDTVFTGKLLFMCKVLIFTLEVNYGDFFAESGIIQESKPQNQTQTPKK